MKSNDVVLHTGDCLHILRSLKSGSANLVYLDPPFLTQKVHRLSARESDKAYTFDDLWASHSEYVSFLLDRVREMYRVLADSGTLFFHCNDQSSHLARFVLDEIFGKKMFRSEIIWAYRRWSNNQKGLLPAHQTILFYSKTPNFIFNPVLTDYSSSTNIDQIMQKRQRDHRGKAVYAKDSSGGVISSGAKKGVPLSDVWEIPYLNPKARERVGYPTQKPVLLLDRIIRLCSNPGDVVLDPFCGSGTTLVAAQLAERFGIGIDCSEEATSLARRRLLEPIATRSRLLERGRSEYVRDDVDLLDQLKGLGFHPVQRNRGADAILKESFEGCPVLVRIQRQGEPIDSAIELLLKASRGKGRVFLIVVATDALYQMNQYKKFYAENVLVVSSTVLAIKTAIKNLSPIENKQFGLHGFA